MHLPLDHTDPLIARWLPGCIGERHWAVASVEIPDEIRTAEQLEEQGNRVWLPTFRRPVRKRRSRKQDTRKVAALPGYIFVDTHRVVDLEAIYETAGFQYFIRFGDTWGLVDDAVLDDLKRLEVDETRDRPIPPSLHLQDVARIRMDRSFSLGGMTGIVVCVEPGRITVAGGDFRLPVSVPIRLLEVVERRAA